MPVRLAPRAAGAVSMHAVVRRFGSVPVLDGASLSVAPGQIVAVHGPNGSGKTTILRILAGVLAPSEGSLDVCGVTPPSGLSAFVPSGDRMLNWRLSGRQEVTFFSALAGLRRGERPAIVDAALEQLGAGEFADQTVGECSTGQRRRIMIAAVLATRAPLLILDEPYSDLDSDGREAVAAVCGAWTMARGSVVYAAPETGGGPTPDRSYEIVDGVLRGR